jgi:hypothetical protein
MPNYTVQFTWNLDVDISANTEGEAIERAKRCLPRQMGAPDEIECVELEEEDEFECPLGGDETNDCAECVYGAEYHLVSGESGIVCTRREEE